MYYYGHSVSNRGILTLKLKAGYEQQHEAGVLYATLIVTKYNVNVGDKHCGEFLIDSIKIDNKFDTNIVLKGYDDKATFQDAYMLLKETTEDDFVEVEFIDIGGEDNVRK
jgi:hypothetical protein